MNAPALLRQFATILCVSGKALGQVMPKKASSGPAAFLSPFGPMKEFTP
jgi:hypothetical protein